LQMLEADGNGHGAPITVTSRRIADENLRKS
jgi:hypothetical protein